MTDLQFMPDALDRKGLLSALRSLRKGDFSVRLPMDLVGIDGEIAQAFNEVVEINARIVHEFSRIRDDVGRDGQTSRRARLPAPVGSWADCVDSVNALIEDLVRPTAEVARVVESVARGDLSQRMLLEMDGRPLRGEFLRIGKIVNTMVDELGAFASEVSRVAREVGTDGKLGGQARVPGVAGTWKDLGDGVNLMAANLTGQVRNIAEVTAAMAKGDLTKKITVNMKGEILELKSTINTMVDQLNGFASEVSRVAREVGTDGKLGVRAHVPGVAGTWKDLSDGVNLMAANLTGQVRNIAEVTAAVAKGDLTKKITVDVKGDILELKSTINTIVDQLNAFASEVSRVAREVGIDGKLGGQARVPGVAGTWKDLSDGVNLMAANLTGQMRNIAEVTAAVAKGDLTKKITVDVKGESLELKSTINAMVDQLNGFASEVSRVVREVGIEGKLGGQARVPGAAGLWRDLTNNVNQLAANLTTQVRAIAEVATAVTKGDLTRSIMIEAMGEVAVLKDNINEMIRNVKETTVKNNEQDWLKTNLAKFTRMLQSHGDLVTISRLVLSELAPLMNVQQGALYTRSAHVDEPRLELIAAYASRSSKHLPKTVRIGEGLVGQCAHERKRIVLEDVPEGYIRISSALGSAAPLSILVMPVLFEGEVKAVIELASLKKFSQVHLSFLDQLTESIGVVFNTIETNMRTEALLEQSQSLTKELQSQQDELKKTNDRLEQQAQNLQNSEKLLKTQQEELQRTNEELHEKARQLSEQMEQVEYKNREVEYAKAALEDKAEQLALSSRYKSEFLANMSHELRTPLNALLILAKLLADNAGNNLTPKQIEFAQTIYSAGTDLLSIINDILDLAKIESGTVTLDIAPQRFLEMQAFFERTFRQIAQGKGLNFTVDVAPGLPAAIQTDEKPLQQILKNLLSNAFKFTERGSVKLQVSVVKSGWTPGHAALDAASGVVAFAVTDTGIGIPEHKQSVIFEAFRQADGTTSRRYGGTGLGLSISRELAYLLGGEIVVESRPGKGSTFTLYLPLAYSAGGSGAAPETSTATPGTDAVSPGRFAASPAPKTNVAIRPQADLSDDRDNIQPGERLILIVENDVKFAASMLAVTRDNDFKGAVAQDASKALALIKEHEPDAVMLGLLPDGDGWAALDILKHDLETRHIPISIISMESDIPRCLQMGALQGVHKPAARETLQEILLGTRKMIAHEIRRVIVADGDDAERFSIIDALRGEGMHISVFSTGHEALDALHKGNIDCMVLGTTLRDMTAMDLIKKIFQSTAARELPFVIYGGGAAESDKQGDLGGTAELVVLKTARTLDALLEEATSFLRETAAHLPTDRRRPGLDETAELAGKKVLIVDDDIRNIFALTGALEEHGMHVLDAENGKNGIEKLKSNPDVDVVLMDIMMPEFDGYDTIRAIRGLEEFRDIPIIAVTAKAMKGDREKCIDAGASDYISKPVNIEQLLSLMRIRLAQRPALQ